MREILSVHPTPVQLLVHVSNTVGHPVWIKRDDRTHPRYGGNKIRKLTRILAQARTHDATDLITAGAIGSHHVLATAVHGQALGFTVHAVVIPQPYTAHAVQTARASASQAIRLIPTRSAWEIPVRMALEITRLRTQHRRPFLIPVGGSSPHGAAGYVDAMRELATQVDQRILPAWPDVIVCALGSGGTHAGILAGARAYGAPSQIVGVQIAEFASRRVVAWLAHQALLIAEPALTRRHRSFTPNDVQVLNTQLGRGYGHPTETAREAQEIFARDGITLDETYTAKAAAGLIAMARRDRSSRSYLFWHTLSSAPMEPLGSETPLPPHLQRLFLTSQ